MLPEQLVGLTIGERYELLSLLGKGRSGLVYRAQHKQLQRIVAVKVLLHDHNDDANAIARFEREARSAAFLHHPNIVTIYDLGVVSGKYAYIVMEFIDGMDLGRVFGTEGRLPTSRAVRIASQICSALSHAHNKAVIHRDLKPTNVMLQDLEDYPDFVKLVDFGLAKQVKADGEISEQLTVEGQVFGTPAYMSPEQCQGKRLDGRSDIYSLGCVCFKMLTGVMPVSGMNILDFMMGHVHRAPLTFEEAYPEHLIPQSLQKVVYRALSKEPEDRQQSMAEFRQQLLDALVEQTTMSPRVVSSREPVAADQTTYDRVLTELQQAAQGGDASSQFALAIKMDHGEGLPFNKDGALYWLRQSAERGFAEAQYHLGRKLLHGEGCDQNGAEAVSWFGKAAQQGNDQAAWQLAGCLETGEGIERSLPEAIAWYRYLYSHGHQHAEQKLTTCYLKCLHDAIPAEGILEWIKQRPEGGDPETLYTLAQFLKRFDPNNGAEIFHALSTAAQLGHGKAQFELAIAYLLGQGVARNDSEAVRLLKASSAAGNIDASLALAGCLASARGTPQDLNAAVALLQTAAQNDSLQAKAILGCMALLGEGGPRNIARGAALLKEAADGGDSFAQWKLALCHKSGIGAVKDPKKCDHWFLLSSERSFDQGPVWPWTTQQLQFSEAVQYFQSASSTGNKNAMYWLGIAHEYGYGVPRNLPKALECYRSAVQRGVPEAQAKVAQLQQAMGAQRI